MDPSKSAGAAAVPKVLSVPVLAWLRDSRGHCLQVSPTVCQFVGKPAESLLGAAWLDCVHPDDRAALRVREASRAVNVSSAIEYRLLAANGTYRWVLDLGAGAQADGTEALLGLCTEGLTSATATDELIGMIAHDLRAPLRVLEGLAAAALDGGALANPSDCQASLGKIQLSARRMMNLLNDMLELGRVAHAAPRIHRIDLARLIQSAYDDALGEYPGREASLDLQVSGSCDADPSLLRQVLVNLLANALKFTSRVTGASIRVQALRGPATLTLVVEDNGAGFPPEEAARLFLPFQRLHARTDYDGHGMGLAIVRRIVESHGGQVRAEALPGHGARFLVTLPQVA